MNKVILIGRLCDDPKIMRTSGEKPTTVARYKLAVDRAFKREGDDNADFISCVAFGKNGDFAQKYLHKGMKIAIEGSIRTGSYTKDDNTKAYTTDVVVDRHEFCESKKATGEEAPAGSYNAPQNGSGGFGGYAQPGSYSANDFDMLEGEDGQLPF